MVVLVLDGLGWDQLQARLTLAPTLSAMEGRAITTVAPSTTATALASITTGTMPGEHGLVGYRFEIRGEILNVLRWNTPAGDARTRISPDDVQMVPPFWGESVPVVTKAEFEGSGFTLAHLRGGRLKGWRTPSVLVSQVAQLVQKGAPVVYAYYEGIDKIAHEFGLGSFYDRELGFADYLVDQLLGVLPDDVALLVTADHGQVDVGSRLVRPSPDLLRLVRVQSGEARFRWFHARQGAEADVLQAATDEFASRCWVVSVAQIIDEQWFGPRLGPSIRRRLGDVAVVPFEPIGIDDPADGGLFELVSRHGSLTSAEMFVPLLAARGRQ